MACVGRVLELYYFQTFPLSAARPPGTMGVDSVDAVGGELQLDSWVTAHLVDGSSHRGVLHTVDPETGTVILLKPEGVSALHRTVVRAAVLTWLSSGVRSPIQTS